MSFASAAHPAAMLFWGVQAIGSITGGLRESHGRPVVGLLMRVHGKEYTGAGNASAFLAPVFALFGHLLDASNLVMSAGSAEPDTFPGRMPQAPAWRQGSAGWICRTYSSPRRSRLYYFRRRAA